MQHSGEHHHAVNENALFTPADSVIFLPLAATTRIVFAPVTRAQSPRDFLDNSSSSSVDYTPFAPHCPSPITAADPTTLSASASLTLAAALPVIVQSQVEKELRFVHIPQAPIVDSATPTTPAASSTPVIPASPSTADECEAAMDLDEEIPFVPSDPTVETATFASFTSSTAFFSAFTVDAPVEEKVPVVPTAQETEIEQPVEVKETRWIRKPSAEYDSKGFLKAHFECVKARYRSKNRELLASAAPARTHTTPRKEKHRPVLIKKSQRKSVAQRVKIAQKLAFNTRAWFRMSYIQDGVDVRPYRSFKGQSSLSRRP